ncbi:MAG: NADH-quinone oxidoreductase subunit M [Candidatus Margulisiibacteriota bacterium]|nr:NADH-quinone oxidoreductase subunit M [Candidatus Margulisiibacteriota bacterium]
MGHAPILIVVIPLLAAFLTHLTKYVKLKRGAEIVAAIGMVVPLALLLSLGRGVIAGGSVQYNLGGWPPPVGISLTIDGLSFFFALMVLGIGLLIVLYSLGIYIFARRYYSLLLIALSGILGLVLTRDIFNMYVFFEVLAVASYVLVAYKHKPRAVKASFKYLIMTEAAWVLFLLAIAILYGLTGSLNMDSIALQIDKIYQANPQVIYLVFSLMMVSFGIKCGMFPLHTWIPEVHSQAPTPVSSLLSGLILKVGLYAMLRIFFLFFGTTLLLQSAGQLVLYLGVITLVLGACLALVQDELKKLLAYSSISQIGFVLVGIGLGTELGLKGGLFHIFNHALIKAALFFCAGIIISQIGFWRISRMKGIWRQMPGVTFSFCILSLAIIGVPPFNGFVSKLFILQATLAQKNYLVIVFLFMGILLTAAYYFRVIQTFFSPEEFQHKPDFVPQPVGPFEHLSTYVVAVLCLLVGLFPDVVIKFIQPAIKVLLP